MREWCFWLTLWKSVKSFFQTGDMTPVAGHTYVSEFVGPAYVYVSRCECCGKYSVTWSQTPPPEHLFGPPETWPRKTEAAA
jgi:hypothetical protein